MNAISTSFSRIYHISEYTTCLLSKYSNLTKENYVLGSGIINNFWQSWNNFWRSFWLTYLLGGSDLKRETVNPLPVLIGKSEKEAIHYVLFLLGKRTNPNGRIRGSFQEPTWGDLDVILKIANLSFPPSTDISTISIKLLSAFNVLGNTPKHFQLVRNCAIHLDVDTILVVKNDVLPHYAIRNFKYPTEILFSKEIHTRKVAYQHWIDELLAVIKIIYI